MNQSTAKRCVSSFSVASTTATTRYSMGCLSHLLADQYSSHCSTPY